MNEHATARAVRRGRVADRDRSRCGRAVEDDFQTVPGPAQAAVADGELIDEQAGDRGVRQVDMHAVSPAVRDGARIADRAQYGSDRREVDAVGSAVADDVVAFGDIETSRGSIQVQADAVRATVVDRAARDQDRSATGVHADSDTGSRALVDDRSVDRQTTERRGTSDGIECGMNAVVVVRDRVVGERDQPRAGDVAASDRNAIRTTNRGRRRAADVESIDQDSVRGRSRNGHQTGERHIDRHGNAGSGIRGIVDELNHDQRVQAWRRGERAEHDIGHREIDAVAAVVGQCGRAEDFHSRRRRHVVHDEVDSVQRVAADLCVACDADARAIHICDLEIHAVSVVPIDRVRRAVAGQADHGRPHVVDRDLNAVRHQIVVERA